MVNQESLVNCAPDRLYISCYESLFLLNKSEASAASVNDGESLIKIKQERSWSAASVVLSQHPEVL